jgi:hypothetical protein
VNSLFHYNNIHEKKAIWVVKHNYKPENKVKMDGMVQDNYNKKLWSSLILFDLDHPKIKALTPEIVNTKTGSYLHKFEWLDGSDIGELDERWNWIPQASPTGADRDDLSPVGAVHYTEGIPGMKFRGDTVWDETWYKEIEHYKAAQFKNDPTIMVAM